MSSEKNHPRYVGEETKERKTCKQVGLTTSNRHLVLALPRQPELPQTADSGVLSYKPHRHLCLLRNFRERERLLHMICILKSNMAAKISDKMAAISWNCHISDFLYRSLLTLILVALCRFIRSGNSKLWHFLTRLYILCAKIQDGHQNVPQNGHHSKNRLWQLLDLSGHLFCCRCVGLWVLANNICHLHTCSYYYRDLSKSKMPTKISSKMAVIAEKCHITSIIHLEHWCLCRFMGSRNLDLPSSNISQTPIWYKTVKSPPKWLPCSRQGLWGPEFQFWHFMFLLSVQIPTT